MADDDESIAFQANAFDVVNSWLLGGRSAAAAEEEEEDEASEQQRQRATSRAPVTLYRPSTSAIPSLTGRNNGSTSGTTSAGNSIVDGKVLTEDEKEMRKKLLRKSGSYASTLEAEAESAIKTAQEEELDKEEQELIKARNERTSVTASNGGKASEPATGEAASSASAPATATVLADVNPKKRKLNAQEELLEKLREDAARAKAKNQKAKLRMQRKKEQERRQKELAAAATAGGVAATTAASGNVPKTLNS